MQLNKTKFNFVDDWSFEFISQMKQNTTYIFTTKKNRITIFVERDCNLDEKMTYGWSVSIFDKDMNDLNYFGFDNISELESGFKNMTNEIVGYFLVKSFYCLKDFNKEELAYETALAEIENKKIFDEFGNLIKEID